MSLNEKSLNLEKISLEEINKDFMKWSLNLEEEKSIVRILVLGFDLEEPTLENAETPIEDTVLPETSILFTQLVDENAELPIDSKSTH